MANSNKVQGLTPVKYLNGADWDGKGRMYHIDSGNTGALFVGDPVTLVAGVATIAGEDNGLPTVSIATAAAPWVGVILAIGTSARGGPYANLNDLTKVSAPATKTVPYFALVADDPNIIYMIQEGGTGTAFSVTATSKNANFGFAAPATGVAVSGTFLDNGTAANTTLAMNVKLLGLAQILDNGVWNAYGAYAKWLCLPNNHYYRAGVVGV